MRAARVVAATTWLLLAALGGAPPAAAQLLLTPQPPGPFVVDVRGTTLGVPQASTFFPALSTDTFVPARGFGLQAGAHVFPVAVGTRRLGLGADVWLTRGRASTPLATGTSATGTSTTGTSVGGAATAAARPDVTVTMRAVSPQVSLNFGTSRGWSYLTAGAGGVWVQATAGAATRATTARAINGGAGARWFLTNRLGVGFDLRLHRIGGSTLFAASAGFSLK